MRAVDYTGPATLNNGEESVDVICYLVGRLPTSPDDPPGRWCGNYTTTAIHMYGMLGDCLIRLRDGRIGRAKIQTVATCIGMVERGELTGER